MFEGKGWCVMVRVMCGVRVVCSGRVRVMCSVRVVCSGRVRVMCSGR